MDAIARIILGGLALALVAAWVYALISAIKNERLDSVGRLTWVVVIIFVTGLGALLYLWLAPSRPTRDEKAMADWHRR